MKTAKVSVSLGRNVEQFVPIKIGIDLEDDVVAKEDENASAAYKRTISRLYSLASTQVDELMSEALKELRGQK